MRRPALVLVALSLVVTGCAAPAATTPTTITASSTTSRSTVSTSTTSTSVVTAPPLTSSSVEASSSSAVSTTTTEPSVTSSVEVTEPPQPDPSPEPEPSPEPQTQPPANQPQPLPDTGNHDGKVVVIDPGHNGANGAHPEIINQEVDAGFGQTKACNTTGTETNGGYPEHAFTWAVANDLKDILQSRGITVVMTRGDDDGVGPCVNERAAVGNDAHADAVISIHGDGATEGDEGFYAMTAEREPAGDAVAGQSQALARSVRDGLVDSGLSPSNYLGSDGLWTRDDLGGLNLSLRPTTMIEMGNMRDSSDARLMQSSDGQQRMAQGIAAGVLAFLS